jgi:hypothetical protein
MPWTERQVRYLESSGSPLTAAQKNKMNAELHADPSLGHKKKGSSTMKKEKQPAEHMRRLEIEIHRGPGKSGEPGPVTGHTVHHYMIPKPTGKSGAFMEENHHSFPFDAKGKSSTHGDMLEHIGSHLHVEGHGGEEEGAEED